MTARPLKRILHVEDEPDIRAIAKLTLEALGGYEVVSCESGAEALVRAPEFKPDLVLLDVMMPGMDGPMTLTELRKLPSCSNVAVVFMTAKAQPGEVAKFRSLGAVDVITKPFDPLTLCQQIGALWQGLP
jgi:CheY-like chemotaxis protein